MNGLIQYTVHFADGSPDQIFNADTYALSDGWFVFFRQYATKEMGMISHATNSFAQRDVKNIEGLFPEAVTPKPKLDLVTN